MPKIIENVREQLLTEAKRQIAENGYGKTTIRSVASACGVGVGTVYNYFPSKDVLVATFMLEDWQHCLADMKAPDSTEPNCILNGICSALHTYIEQHNALFADSDAAKVFASVVYQRHKQLRSQIAEIVLPACANSTIEDKAFLAEYIAESLLTWTVAGKSYHELSAILTMLI
jgi:AcrR family transcriptional regulator